MQPRLLKCEKGNRKRATKAGSLVSEKTLLPRLGCELLPESACTSKAIKKASVHSCTDYHSFILTTGLALNSMHDIYACYICP